jgi:hypothetical protein
MRAKRLRILALACLLVSGAIVPALRGQQAQKPLTNVNVIKMVEAGVPESAIVTSIQTSSTTFDLSPEASRLLDRAGVSQRIRDAMMSHRTPALAATPATVGGANVSVINPRGTPTAGTALPTTSNIDPKQHPPIRSNAKRDAASPADASAVATMKSKLDAQLGAFRQKFPSTASVRVPTTQPAPPEIQALKSQMMFVQSIHAQTGLAQPLATTQPGSVSQTTLISSPAVPQKPLLVTTPGQATLGTTAGQPSLRQAPSSSAQQQPNRTTVGAAAPPPAITIAGPPSERQAPSSSANYQPPSGNRGMVASSGMKICLTAQIYRVNNATSGVVFTQDPLYNDYIITGCGFGNQSGQVYLSGAVTNGQIKMVVKQWGPNQIEAVVQPGLTGVLDGWPDLMVVPVPAGTPPAKFPNCRFYAQRQSVPLLGIPRSYAHLANVPVNMANSFGTNYCPGPDQMHLYPCILFNAGPPLSNVANAVDRDGGRSQFNSGEDVYDLSYMTPGFVVDYFWPDWYAWSESICQGWIGEGGEKFGDSIDYSTAGHYGWYLKSSSQIAVDWGVDHCAWRWLGVFNVDDEYNSGYSLQVYVKGPIGVDPWTGKPTGG